MKRSWERNQTWLFSLFKERDGLEKWSVVKSTCFFFLSRTRVCLHHPCRLPHNYLLLQLQVIYSPHGRTGTSWSDQSVIQGMPRIVRCHATLDEKLGPDSRRNKFWHLHCRHLAVLSYLSGWDFVITVLGSWNRPQHGKNRHDPTDFKSVVVKKKYINEQLQTQWKQLNKIVSKKKVLRNKPKRYIV